MRPFNNIVEVDFDMLFFFLNLDVRCFPVRIIINSKYGRKTFIEILILKITSFDFYVG